MLVVILPYPETPMRAFTKIDHGSKENISTFSQSRNSRDLSHHQVIKPEIKTKVEMT